MATIKLRHVNTFTDRHGRVRIYFRHPGCKAIALPGPVGSPEFMEAYNAALAEPRPKTGIPLKAGTLAASAMSYLSSAAFNDKRPETRRSERGIIDRLVEQCGSGKVAELEHDNVQGLIDKKAATPSAARNLLAVMRVLMTHAVDVNMRSDNPAIGVKRPKIKGKGFRPWQDDDAAKYEGAHPVGTRARLVYELYSCTGLRRSDVVGLGRPHVRQLTQPRVIGPYTVTHEFHVVQEKTGEAVDLPILPQLHAAIDALPSDNLSFIVADDGKPLTKESLGNWFHECCQKGRAWRGRMG